MKKQLLFGVLRLNLIFGLVSGVLTQVTGQKYSNEFLSIGVSAKAQGLGNAVVASVDDVTAGYWNPAGLSQLPQEAGLQLGAMHAEWFAGVGKFDYLGIALPSHNPGRRMAVSMIRFGVDGIPNTLSLYEDDGTVNYDNVKEFSAADYGFLFSYARQLKPNFSVGGNVKIVHRRIGPFATSWGFGVDLGLQYKKGEWQFGVLARDITTTFNAWSFNFTEAEKETLELTNNEVPISSVEITKPQLILGAARVFKLGAKTSLKPELDLIVTTDGKRNTLISGNPFSVDPAFGVEGIYNNFLFLRLGVGQFQTETDFDGKERLGLRPSLGVGFSLSALRVDYAFTDIGDGQNRYSHVVSALLTLKPKNRGQ